jgi:hypothetical protein
MLLDGGQACTVVEISGDIKPGLTVQLKAADNDNRKAYCERVSSDATASAAKIDACRASQNQLSSRSFTWQLFSSG